MALYHYILKMNSNSSVGVNAYFTFSSFFEHRIISTSEIILEVYVIYSTRSWFKNVTGIYRTTEKQKRRQVGLEIKIDNIYHIILI